MLLISLTQTYLTVSPSYDPISTHFLLSIPVTAPSLKSSSPLIVNSSNSTPKVIGTIRWTPSTAKVSRLVVREEYRKYGFGRILMEGLHRHVANNMNDDTLRPIIEARDGKKVVKLKLHSQVDTDPH